MSEFGKQINCIVSTDSTDFASFLLASCCDTSQKLDFDMINSIHAACRCAKMKLSLCKDGSIQMFGYNFTKHNFLPSDFGKTKKQSFSSDVSWTHHSQEHTMGADEIYKLLMNTLIEKLCADYKGNQDAVRLMFKVNQ